MRTGSRQGFTLIELLVVIGIIGILIALLMPATRGAREAARRASCAVKLKNLATSLHTYHDNFQGFPSSAFYKDGSNLADNEVSLLAVTPGSVTADGRLAPYGFLVKLLPYFEQGYIYDQIKFKTDDAFSPNNQRWAAKVVPMLNCPSYRGPAASEAAEYTSLTSKPALTNYKALGASTRACLMSSSHVTSEDENGGVLHPYAAYRFNELRAFTQTAILCETKEESYAAWWDGATASIPGFHAAAADVGDYTTPANQAGAVAALNLDLLNGDPAKPFQVATTQFGGTGNMRWGPSSEHPGLVNHACGGTECRSINNDIDPKVYRALISRRADDNGDMGDYFK